MIAGRVASFLAWIREVRVTRAEAEEIFGKEELAKLLAANIVSWNPFDDRMQPGPNTEDFYP